MRPFKIPCMAADPPRLPPPPPPLHDWALLLDVDGTLLDFADRPEAVRVPAELLDTLARLHTALDGAVALVSGRPLAQLDDLFAPLQLPAAGLHGLELREGGEWASTGQSPPGLALVRDAAQALVDKFDGALLEDKGTTLALHWRNAPAAEEPLHEFATSALIGLPGYHLQAGKYVFELRPDGADKGHAILALMSHPQFHDRRPVFLGDDLTDEQGFAAINAHGGHSVLVGHRTPTAAHHALHDPAATRAWLREVALRLAPQVR